MRKFIAAALVAGTFSLPAWAADEYKIMAPAAPGGGWDQTARAMQAALQDGGVAPSVQVTNVPGAGGTIGLAQFVNQTSGDPSQLIVGGYVMVGAILTNNSPVTLDQVTPIARLTGEYEAVVVPAASDIKDMKGLIDKLKADPGAVSWAGGSAGGTDHITAGLIAKAVGVDPTKVNYVAFSGGGEALAAILGIQVTVGITGYGEFASQIQAGQLRLIGISSDERVAGIDAPTFKESGVDVSIQNWRMVAAAPGISAEQKAAITADIEKMVNSPAWQKTLTEKTVAMAKNLEALREAPVTQPFNGPAILSGRASAVFFHEVLGHRLEGQRQRGDEEGQTFTKLLGKQILPPFISVADDPTLTSFEGTSLSGHYSYDDEGQQARGRHGGPQQRQEHPEDNGRRRGSVHDGRLLQLLGQLAHERGQHPHCGGQGEDQIRDHQRGQLVVEAQPPHQLEHAREHRDLREHGHAEHREQQQKGKFNRAGMTDGGVGL